MPKKAELSKSIFKIDSPAKFNEIALKIFQYQYENNIIYRNYLEHISVSNGSVNQFDDIPFLPIDFYKSHKIISGEHNYDALFTSSGTTGNTTSSHYVKDINLYETSIFKGFNIFFGSPEQYTILALLPSYLEKGGSSLVFMAKKLISESKDPNSGFYLNNYNDLFNLLFELRNKKTKVILLGVTYALLDMAEQYPLDFPDLIIMETGGMKGRRKEIIRDELHSTLNSAFGTKRVLSEYGMTELLSQAYSLGNGNYKCPPWMKIKVRDINDPFSYLSAEKTGGINIIDLANMHSCSFIETQDLGKLNPNGSFEVLGRFDNSDIRGCNLLI